MRRLGEIALFTDDVDGASAFYRGLIGAAPVADWPGGANFTVGDGKLLVHERAAALADGPPNEDHFAITVDDLDEMCAALVRKGSASSSSRGTTRGVGPRISGIRTAGRLVELAQS